MYTHDNEVLIFEGFNAVKAAIFGIEGNVTNRKIIKVLFSQSRFKKKTYEYNWLKVRSASLQFPIIICKDEEIAELCSSDTHGGIVGLFSKRDDLSLADFSEHITNDGHGWLMALEGIEDPYNLGFCIRSAYAFGCSGILLPERYMYGADGTVCRSSAGASERIPFFRCDLVSASKIAKENNFNVIAACEKDSVPMSAHPMSLPAIVIIGGEKRGISAALLSECTDRIRIEYARAYNSSLSAVSASAIMSHMLALKNGLL